MPSVSPVILIASCELFRHNGVQEAARNTWIKQWGDAVSYRFVLGRECKAPFDFDEIVLDVADGYEGLTAKVQAARRWATEVGFDYTFHCGADTYVVVPRLLASGYEQSDYSGFLIHDEHRLYAPRNIQFAQGGGGYWLSAKAGAAVESAEIPSWIGKAEDVFVADALFNAGIKPAHDVGYWSWGYRAASDPDTLEGGPFIGTASAITVHLSAYWRKPTYRTEWMYDTHQRVLASGEVWERKNAAAPAPDVK
jgi:hypothetical protein